MKTTSRRRPMRLLAVLCGALGLVVTQAAGSAAAPAAVAGTHAATWGQAQEVPGIAALDQGGGSHLHSVSCAQTGDCSAVGYYRVPSGSTHAFAVAEVNGVWGHAQQVPGIATLDKGLFSELFSVSCAQAGDCSAGGYYEVGANSAAEPFVVGEVNGVWGKAQELPGIAALNLGRNAVISTVSCPQVGNCGAGGHYTDASGHGQALVVNRTS